MNTTNTTTSATTVKPRIYCPVCLTAQPLTPKGYVKKHAKLPSLETCGGSSMEPTTAPLTDEEKRAKHVADLRALAAMDPSAEAELCLARMESTYNKAREDVLADFTKGRGFIQFAEWDGERLVKLETQWLLAQEVRRGAANNKMPLIDALRDMAERQREALIGNDFAGSSTSLFDNASRAAKAKATSEMLRGVYSISYALHIADRIAAAKAELAAMPAADAGPVVS